MIADNRGFALHNFLSFDRHLHVASLVATSLQVAEHYIGSLLLGQELDGYRSVVAPVVVFMTSANAGIAIDIELPENIFMYIRVIVDYGDCVQLLLIIIAYLAAFNIVNALCGNLNKRVFDCRLL